MLRTSTTSASHDHAFDEQKTIIMVKIVEIILSPLLINLMHYINFFFLSIENCNTIHGRVHRSWRWSSVKLWRGRRNWRTGLRRLRRERLQQ
jgi:hypothetical protein